MARKLLEVAGEPCAVKIASTVRRGADGKVSVMITRWLPTLPYQNRLDEVCGLAWSVTYTPWGERVICHLTINGITRSSTGEADSNAEKSEIAGTAAEAQAFKRACSMFGLGRCASHVRPITLSL